MTEQGVTALSTGERIRVYRQRRGQSRERLAQLAGVSPSWLKAVELGTRKADSLRLLIPLAEALDVPLWDLIPGPRRLAPNGGLSSDGVSKIERAMMRYQALPALIAASDDEAPDLDRLRRETDATWSLRNEARFDHVGTRLELLIPEVERAAEAYARRPGEDSALRLRAEAYWLAAYTLFRAGERGELAWIAAERFVETARRVGDPLLVAAGARCVGHVLIHAGRAGEAKAVLTSALDVMEPGVGSGSPDYLSAWGALLLAGAVAAARTDDRATARMMLREAMPAAQRVGDVDRYHMSFGPTNTLIHAVSIAVELGDAGEAVRVGREIDTSRLPADLRGRRAQVHLDLAHAYELQRQDEAAVLRLYEAEREAPELIRYSPAVREMLRAMLRRPGGQTVPGLVGLATRVGVLAE